MFVIVYCSFIQHLLQEKYKKIIKFTKPIKS